MEVPCLMGDARQGTLQAHDFLLKGLQETDSSALVCAKV